MNKPRLRSRSRDPEGHHRPARRLAQDLLAARRRARPARAAARDHAVGSRLRRAAAAGLRHHRALHRQRVRSRIDVEQGRQAQPHRLGRGARRRRANTTAVRRQAGRQRQRASTWVQGARRRRGIPRPRRSSRKTTAMSARQACRHAPSPRTTSRCAASTATDHAARIRPRRHHHQGDDLRRRARKPRPQAAARARRSGARRRRELWRRGARLRHAGIRARRDRARPRHHPLQHQPRRTRADDHRPQLPDQDQRQYRQLRRHLVGRGGSRQDGVGDPLGRRHRDGPLHRPQHPHHPRMDPAQRAGPDRHRADLPGAGEVRRRSGQARPGSSTRTR